jgi:hypothetical protein
VTKPKKGIRWEEAIQEAGAPPEGQLKKTFAERAAEAEAWAQEMHRAPAGRPIVRMGRPGKGEAKTSTELVTFRTDKTEKEALEALAAAQGRSLSDLLRDVTHGLVATFRAGQRAARTRG